MIDAEGNPVKPGELGQIAVLRPDPVMFLEYWGNPDATREKFIGDWMTTGDQGVIDGFFVNGSAALIGRIAGVVRWVQSGYIYHYAFGMILGVFVLMTYFVWLAR